MICLPSQMGSRLLSVDTSWDVPKILGYNVDQERPFTCYSLSQLPNRLWWHGQRAL